MYLCVPAVTMITAKSRDLFSVGSGLKVTISNPKPPQPLQCQVKYDMAIIWQQHLLSDNLISRPPAHLYHLSTGALVSSGTLPPTLSTEEGLFQLLSFLCWQKGLFWIFSEICLKFKLLEYNIWPRLPILLKIFNFWFWQGWYSKP